MKHLLMDPAFPDIVGDYALAELIESRAEFGYCANDNGDDFDPELSDPLFVTMAQRDIAASRLW
jgi:hypothetical protein